MLSPLQSSSSPKMHLLFLYILTTKKINITDARDALRRYIKHHTNYNTHNNILLGIKIK